MRARPHPLWLAAVLPWAGCSRADGAPAALPQAPAQPEALTFDFGTIPHGEAREHDFVLDPRSVFGPDFYAVGAHVDCSCARTALLLRDATGAERPIEVLGPGFAPRPGELLVVRTQVDTSKKEPIDQVSAHSRVTMVFQPVDARDASGRRYWPLDFHFAVDSPVRLRPFAVLDFERVPECAPRQVTTVLSSDLPGRPIRFGPTRCDDDRVQVELETRGDDTFVRATLKPRPGERESMRTLVTIDTDLETGYQVHLAAIAVIVPDLEAVPAPKLSFRADLRQEQTPERAQSQYLLVTDHDARRPAEFVVARLVDAAGKDARHLFDVTFEAAPGDPRTRRLHLRWVGRAEREFRGELVLAKDPEAGPFLSIEVVALHAGQP